MLRFWTYEIYIIYKVDRGKSRGVILNMFENYLKRCAL